MKYEALSGILSFSLATYIFHLLRAGVVGRGGINSLGRKKIIYQLQTGLTAKKRRVAPCWPTRCRLESFYRINVTNTDTQLIEPQLRDPPGPRGERGFRWDENAYR